MTEHAQTADTDDLSTSLAVHAAVYCLKREVVDAEARVRARVTSLLCDQHARNGTVTMAVRIPEVGQVAKATVTVPKPAATIVDKAAFTEFVADHSPDEVETVITIRVGGGGFGADAALQDIRDLLGGMDPSVVSSSEETTVRPAYQKAMLGSDNLVGGKLAHVTEDGELLDVPGVDVVTPVPSSFSFKSWDSEAAGRVLSTLMRSPEALRRALDGVPLAIEDGTTVAGEVVPEEPTEVTEEPVDAEAVPVG